MPIHPESQRVFDEVVAQYKASLLDAARKIATTDASDGHVTGIAHAIASRISADLVCDLAGTPEGRTLLARAMVNRRGS
jgi:hypothetical protein